MDRRLAIFSALLILTGCKGEEEYPRGHLQPFGGHTDPGLVEERETIPSPQEFWNDYVKVSKPVVFRGIGKVAPLFRKWTDQYLKETFGDLELRLEGKKEKGGSLPKGDVFLGRDTLRNFVNTYHEPNSNKYIVSELPTPMYSDVMVPSFMSCGSFSQRLVEIDLWMSGGGTSSILHKDAFNTLNCLYNGTKEWKLVEYKYEDKIYKAWEPEFEIGGFSRINPERVDLIKYPRVAEVPWSKITVNPGDCLFLPKGVYHQVKSYGTNNLAIAILFSRFDMRKNISFNGCEKPRSKPLSEFDIDWQYPGYGEMSMGNDDLQHYKLRLLKIGRNGLTLPDVEKIFRDSTSDFPSRGGTPEKFFDVFGLKPEDGIIPYTSLKDLTKDQTRRLALMLLQREPSNSGVFEYNIINPNKILHEIPALLKQKRLQRQDFVGMYTEILNGTQSFANDIFDTLAGPGNLAVTQEQLVRRIQDALKPYYAWQKNEIYDENDAYEKVGKLEKRTSQDALQEFLDKLKAEANQSNTEENIKEQRSEYASHNHSEL